MTVFGTKMNFEIIQDSVNAILAAEGADNNFEVLQFDPNSNSAEKIAGKNQVICYYNSGQFPSFDNALTSNNIQHKPTFKIVLYSAEKAKDTDTEFIYAGLAVDRKINILIRQVWQSIMQGSSKYLGTDSDIKGIDPTVDQRWGIVSSRNIENITKSKLETSSGYAIMSAQIDLTCQTNEEPVSVTGLPINDANTDLTLTSDPEADKDEPTDFDSSTTEVESPEAVVV
jgi:hypothetical protein